MLVANKISELRTDPTSIQSRGQVTRSTAESWVYTLVKVQLKGVQILAYYKLDSLLVNHSNGSILGPLDSWFKSQTPPPKNKKNSYLFFNLHNLVQVSN
jgi:hypothetical protein